MSKQIITPLGALSTSGESSNLKTPTGSKRDTPEAIGKAASQFEALLIGQLMKSAREGDGEGWLGTGSDEAGSTLTELSEQQVSQALASQGGLGLAKMISAGLTKAAEHQSVGSSYPAETR